MPVRTVTTLGSGVALGLAVARCAPTPAGPPGGPRELEFVLRAGAGVAGPVYVQAVDVDNQPGWVRVTRQGEPVFLRERCDVETCGAPGGVCGAAIPLVRDVAAGGREIVLRWDRATSVVDARAGCQTRRPAPDGAYVARFCYARRAELAEGGLVTGGDRQGQVVAPVCREVPFVLPGGRRAVFDVPNG